MNRGAPIKRTKTPIGKFFKKHRAIGLTASLAASWIGVSGATMSNVCRDGLATSQLDWAIVIYLRAKHFFPHVDIRIEEIIWEEDRCNDLYASIRMGFNAPRINRYEEHKTNVDDLYLD